MDLLSAFGPEFAVVADGEGHVYVARRESPEVPVDQAEADERELEAMYVDLGGEGGGA